MRHNNDLRDDPQEREISLGTATILGIFLALALVCAAFFGFGYSLGRHSEPTPVAVQPEVKGDSPFSKFKSQPAATDTESADTDSSQTDAPAAAPAARGQKPPEQVAVPRETAKPQISAHNVALPVPTRPAPAAATIPGGAQASIVQVSATSRRGDAEALIAALKQKGYAAAIRQEPQDKLFHVQLGPFVSKQDAETMRKRLDTDGYKAIVK